MPDDAAVQNHPPSGRNAPPASATVAASKPPSACARQKHVAKSFKNAPNPRCSLGPPLFSVSLAALFSAALSLPSSAYVGISVSIAPPPIPVYVQPLCPAPGYLWTPGYWDYDGSDYYWVPGVWVAPPRIGFLWTPGYWGFRGGSYVFSRGYWGPTVGFYGGIDYGGGYVGRGYCGGEWVGNTFRYNTAVTRVDTTVIRNTYVNTQVINNYQGSRAGFNGPNGAQARPTTAERVAATAVHLPPTAMQSARTQSAKNNPALHAASNQGNPKPGASMAGNRNSGATASPVYRPGDTLSGATSVKPAVAHVVPNSHTVQKPHHTVPSYVSASAGAPKTTPKTNYIGAANTGAPKHAKVQQPQNVAHHTQVVQAPVRPAHGHPPCRLTRPAMAKSIHPRLNPRRGKRRALVIVLQAPAPCGRGLAEGVRKGAEGVNA